MKVILKENIENLGKTGDLIKVSDGYARNYLLPRNLVLIADEKSTLSLEHHKKILARKSEREKKDLETISKQLEQFSCTVARKVGENEKLFGSVTSTDIAQVLKKAGFHIEKHQIQLSEPIKQLGIFTVPIKLSTDLQSSLKVWVVQE